MWTLREVGTTLKVMFRAMKLAASTEKVALLMVEPVLLAVSLYVIIVESLPSPWRVMYGLVAGIDTFSLSNRQTVNN